VEGKEVGMGGAALCLGKKNRAESTIKGVQDVRRGKKRFWKNVEPFWGCEGAVLCKTPKWRPAKRLIKR